MTISEGSTTPIIGERGLAPGVYILFLIGFIAGFRARASAITVHARIALQPRLSWTKLSFVAGASLCLSTSITQAGWFSSEKYDCENKAVVAQVQELIACQTMLQCSALGLKFAQAKAMSKEEITAKFDALIEPEIAAATKRVTVQVNMPAIRRGVTEMLGYERDVVLTFPTLFQNVTTVPDDYTESISRYACHMNFIYEPKVIMPFWKMVLKTTFLKDPIQAAVAEDMDRKNPGSDYIGMLVNTTIQSQGLLAKGKEPVTAFFTVQPGGDNFIVEVKNMTKVLPGTQ